MAFELVGGQAETEEETPLWFPVVSPEEWAEFEAKAEIATPWETYAPPQKSGGCTSACVYSCLRIPCCTCSREICKCCSSSHVNLERVWLSSPDDWFARMLAWTNPRTPASLKGIFWLDDNVAAEGVLTLQDADWRINGIGLKSARYNWTVDANDTWGLVLSCNFWLRGGRHQFQMSPNGKWINIAALAGRSNFIYIIQPGDVIKRPDGTVIDVTPGEDMMRITFEEFSPESPITYQYMLRKIAYLDGSGALVKTKNFDEMQRVVAESTCCRELCTWRESSEPTYRDLKDAQVLTFAPPQELMEYGR